MFSTDVPILQGVSLDLLRGEVVSAANSGSLAELQLESAVRVAQYAPVQFR